MPTLEHLQAAYLQLAARARAKGVKALVATMMPFEGVPFPGFYSPEKEKLRVAVNEWLRASKAFDGLIVRTPVSIVEPQPDDIHVGLGQPVTISPTVQGTLPLTFQWYFNGAILPGQKI